AEPLSRRQDHGDVRPAAPPLARSAKRGIAADDAGGAVGRAGLLLYRRARRDVRTNHDDRADDGLRPHRFCRAAHADAGAQEPGVLALLHLRARCRIRLAGAGDDRARPCGRGLWHSPTLSARQAAASARILKLQPFTSTAYRTLKRRMNMEVILLERVAKLGQMGEVVRVKDGFARNFLLKRGKALRATSDNRAKFDGMKAELEANNLKAKGEATKVAEKINGRNVVVLRQASETGQLFGSVSVRDIIASFEADGVTISRSQVLLDAPIKTIGK